MIPNLETARAQAERDYAATRSRLASDPEYQRLLADAEREAKVTPQWWVARNVLAIHVELNTPMWA